MSSNNALAWKQGMYYFDDVPIKELLDKIALYYNYKITVKNPKILENYRCTGKFKEMCIRDRCRAGNILSGSTNLLYDSW